MSSQPMIPNIFGSKRKRNSSDLKVFFEVAAEQINTYYVVVYNRCTFLTNIYQNGLDRAYSTSKK